MIVHNAKGTGWCFADTPVSGRFQMLLGGCHPGKTCSDIGGDVGSGSLADDNWQCEHDWNVPVWLLLLVGSFAAAAGSLQQPGLQGLFAQLVGMRSQGLFQAFFFVW